jgi:hypothetical protein
MMDLHRTSAPCGTCGEYSLFLWRGDDGGLICQSCLVDLVRWSDREVARARQAVLVTVVCFGLMALLLFWSWLAG